MTDRLTLSETLVDFAQPALMQVPAGGSLHVTKLVMGLAVRVWNDRVMEAAGGTKDVAATLRADLAKAFPPGGVAAFLPLFEVLSDRKRLYFADDRRLVADWSLEATKNGWRLRAAGADLAAAESGGAAAGDAPTPPA